MSEKSGVSSSFLPEKMNRHWISLAGGPGSLLEHIGILREHGFHFAPELGCVTPDGGHVLPGQRLVLGHWSHQHHVMGEPDREPLPRERIGCRHELPVHREAALAIEPLARL